MSSLGSFLFSNTRRLELRGGTLFSTRGQGQNCYDGALLSLASQDEACVRMEQQLNLHLGLDGIHHTPLLGWLLVRVGTTGLHHPYTTSIAAQHRNWVTFGGPFQPRPFYDSMTSGWGDGTCPVGAGSILHQREGLLFTARDEMGWSGEKHPLQSCCGFSPAAGTCSEVGSGPV